MGDTFIQLPSGSIINISCIEYIHIEKNIYQYVDKYGEKPDKRLDITTQTNTYYTDVSFLDELLECINVVNLEKNKTTKERKKSKRVTERTEQNDSTK